MSRAPDPLDVVVNKSAIRRALLSWYDRAGRTLPWRVRGARAHPYRVWLSEIMLQQTTVAAVKPYFETFLARWPTIEALAAADRDAVLAAWAGLGYYSRARNLHACATLLAENGFPADEAGWRALPGVGAYTAAAVAAIALGQPANVVDGNIERVMARLFAVSAPLPGAKTALRDHAASLVNPHRPGDWAQALMDLGATVCTPRQPACGDCPIKRWCAAAAAGDAETYPRKAAKPAKPERVGAAYFLSSGASVLLVRRPDKGLLGGMIALPSTEWRAEAWTDGEIIASAPAPGRWRKLGAVRHVFTHFALTLDVWAAATRAKPAGEWRVIAELDSAGLPTVFAKAAALGVAAR
jgi:A/G-specific adenine glycosylase